MKYYLFVYQAQQSRQKYLASHMIRVDEPEEQDEEAIDPSSAAADPSAAVDPSGAGQATLVNQLDDELIYTTRPPPPPKTKDILQPLDVTPFLRYSKAP